MEYNWRSLLVDKKYVIMEIVDSGSFGEVYTLRKGDDGTVFAVKSIKACGNVTDDEYILAEIRSLLQLKHPHIITMVDLVINQTIACIVMEYAQHGNLETYTIKNKPLKSSFICRSFQQVLSAVNFCHSNDIAHKDINPSNILIFDENCVKLADFGLAVKCHDALGNLVLCEDYLGQNSYLAPEVLRHKPHNAMLADLWSLGSLLFYICFALQLFEGDAEAIIQNQIATGVQFPSAVNNLDSNDKKEFKLMILQLCRINPEERQSSSLLIKTWENSFL